MSTKSYVPLRMLIPWPDDIFPELHSQFSVLDRIGIEDFSYSNKNGTEMSVDAVILTELSLGYSGLEGWELVFGNKDGLTSVQAKLSFGEKTVLTIENFKIQLRIPQNVLKKMKRENGKFVKDQDDQGELKPVVVDLADVNVALSFDPDAGIQFAITPNTDSIRFGPAMIGDSGVILEVQNISLNLDGKGARPNEAPEDWKGVYIEQGSLYIPEVMDGSVNVEGLGIGQGGVYGRIEGMWELSYDPEADEGQHFTGDLAGKMLGMEGGVSQIALEFVQTIPVEAELEGRLQLPFFDEPVHVVLNAGLDGEWYASLQDTDEDGLYHFYKENIVEAQIESISFGRQNHLWIAALSGKIRPLIGGEVDWPAFDVEELQIDSDGNVRVDGGWLDIPEKSAFNFHGFQGEAEQFGFGNDEDDRGAYRWMGISGKIKLVETLEVGGSVEGLKLKWYEDGSVDYELKGIGVQLDLPGILTFSGEVAFINDEGHSGFRGDIALELPSVGVNMDAVLVIGRKETDPSYNYYYIYVDAEISSGIALGPTGLSLYGLSGLFAYQMEPDKSPEQDWYEDWYRRDPPGVTASSKWNDQQDALAFGAGLTVGTAGDSGYLVSAKALFALILPGPIVLIQGKANFLENRPSHGDGGAEGAFEALAVIDNRAGEFLMNVSAAYQLDDQGRVVDIHAGAEAFFDYHQAGNWHFYLGEKEPREKRIRAGILSLFSAESYLMLEPDEFSFGYWQGFDERWRFGPVKVEASAWAEAHLNAAVSPRQFWGKAGLHGELDMSVYGFGFGFYLDAGIEVNTPSPFSILAHLSFGLNLPWPLPDFDVKIELKWADLQPLPYPDPLQEVSAGHELIQHQLKLPQQASDNQPVIPVDSKPVITFSHPVWDEAGIVQVNAQPPQPGWENAQFYADKTENKEDYAFRYELTKITLETNRGNGWKKSDESLQGVWLPAEGANGELAPTKLMLFSSNAFAYTRYSTRDALDALVERHPQFPCIPKYEKKMTCVTFEGLQREGTFQTLQHEELHFETLDENSYFEAENALKLKSDLDGRSHMSGLRLPAAAGYIQLSFQLKDADLYLYFYNKEMEQVGTSVNFRANEGTGLLSRFGETVYGSKKMLKPDMNCGEVCFISFHLSPVKTHTKTKELPQPELLLYEVCTISCAEFEKEKEHEEYIRRQSTATWDGEGNLLQPYSNYRLTVQTNVRQKVNDADAAGSPRVYEKTYYFRTEGPPGFNEQLTTSGSKQGQNAVATSNGDSDQPAYKQPHSLQTLKPYVAASIPVHGQNPFYRAYDPIIQFKKDTFVELMYRMARRDIGLYLFDNNKRPERDAFTGKVIAWLWKDEAMAESVRDITEQRWQQVLQQAPCVRDVELGSSVEVLANETPNRILKPQEKYTAKINPIVLYETFTDFDDRHWRVVDEGNTDVPSGDGHWKVEAAEIDGEKFFYMRQGSNIHSRDSSGYDLPAARGTYYLHESEAGSQGRITVKLAGLDNDAVGVMFGYQDNNNYYRFSMDSERKYRRLIRMENGHPHILAEDQVSYEAGRIYTVAIEVFAGVIRVDLDDEKIFEVEESAFQGGKLALYCWGNDDARFYEVTCEEWGGLHPSLYEMQFITSRFVNFQHHLHFFDDQVNPLLLPANGDAAANEFESIWPIPLVLPQDRVTMDLVKVRDQGEIAGLLLRSPEPIEWERVDIEMERRGMKLITSAPSAVKITACERRTRGFSQYNFQVQMLVRETVSLEGWQLQLTQDISPTTGALTKGAKWVNLHRFTQKLCQEGEWISAGRTMTKGVFEELPQFAAFRLVDSNGNVVHVKGFDWYEGESGSSGIPIKQPDLKLRELERLSGDGLRDLKQISSDRLRKNPLQPKQDNWKWSQVDIQAIPSDDGTALFIRMKGMRTLEGGGHRLHLRFHKKKEGLPTYQQWGSTDDEPVTLEFNL